MRCRGADVLGRIVLAGLLWVSESGVFAQGRPAPASVGAELQQLGQAASTIFVGQITSISRNAGSVEITFRVEQPVRGASNQTGGCFVLREWAGLWAPGQTRYLVGQRVLAFLHGAGGAGFSSPVRGAEGLVPVVVSGADAPQLLDIRRIAASVVRAPGTPLPTEANGAIQLADALHLVGGIHSGAGDPARRPLPTRGAPPRSALERLAAGDAAGSTSQKAPLSTPILRRSPDARR